VSETPRWGDLPLAIWPCAQRTSQQQRRERYLPASNRHPAKMLPELARRAIEHYSDPGDLVLDPMCGIGTTLVEAVHLGRDALGIELERRWASLATANLAHARAHGATGRAAVLEGDARQLPRLLTRAQRTWRTRDAGASAVTRLGVGSVELILTSPPYGRDIELIDKPAWIAGGSLGDKDSRNYSNDHDNLGHARGDDYRAAMREVYAACAAALKPGGFLIVVTKNLRHGRALHDLASATVELCQATGLRYWQHVIALHAAIRGDDLVARPSFWQLSTLRKARARGERIQLVCHEDVLVFRKPDAVEPARTEPAAASRKAS
jgi:DNA modification methylase